MTLTLSVTNLNIQTRAAKSCLLEPLSFNVSPNRPLCILGESGAGKSLIAQALLGNLPDSLAATGEVHFDGRDWMKESTAARQALWGRRITLLPQEPTLALNPVMKAGRQLRETYQHVGSLTPLRARARSKRTFRELGLTGAEHKRAGELSGGMAQRMVFACAVAGGARILVADEPTKGLDADRKTQVIDQLKRYINDRSLLILITHDIDVVRAVGGQALVLREGRCVEQGDTRSVLAEPGQDYSRQLVAATPSQWPVKELTTTVSSDMAIEVDNLAFSRAGAHLCSGLSFNLKQGQIKGVFGTSGSGKSTLGDIILGLLEPDHGTVHRSPGWQRHQFLKLYQDPSSTIPPYWTLQQLLQDLVQRHSLDSAEVDRLAGRLGLNHDLLSRRSGDVSGGELQRFSMLRALLLKPLFLFADEPTSRLDPITQRQTIDLLVDSAREFRFGLLLVSHDRALLEKRCDEVIEI